MDDNKLKERFLENLKNAGGIIYVACENTGISRSKYYGWLKNDPSFAERCDEVKEAQIDYVESKLMGLINASDTTATIYYLKTKGRKRGWSEKQPQQTQEEVQQPVAALPNPDDGKVKLASRIKNKKDYIVKLLKNQGKYTAELTYQVDITAQLLVRADILADEIFDKNHTPVNVELSREGNERESISPKERLYLEVLRQSQKALTALGMNTDSKQKIENGDDSLQDFMDAFKDDNKDE